MAMIALGLHPRPVSTGVLEAARLVRQRGGHGPWREDLDDPEPAPAAVAPEPLAAPVTSRPCTICGSPTTLRRGDRVLCAAHVGGYDRLHNTGTSAPIATMRAAEAGGSVPTMRERLRRKNETTWEDRPLAVGDPVAGD